MKPYYSAAGITLYKGDCREVLPALRLVDVVLVTDPPYGIALSSGMGGEFGDLEVAGDGDTTTRDWALEWARGRPAIVFGTWRVQRPENIRARLIWEKGNHVGMGDLSIPWKPNDEEIYILGEGFTGHRGSGVLHYQAPVPGKSSGRLHPTEKPVNLMAALMVKCPPGIIVDPFAGSGSTLVAAKKLGRQSVGVELEERYCETAAKRLDLMDRQGELFGGAA